MKGLGSLAMLAAATVATPAFAGLIAKPVEQAGQTIRYQQGQPTIEDDKPNAGVRVLPIAALDHGSYQFAIAVFNKSASPVNIGIDNVTVLLGGQPIPCLTKDEMARAAKKRAFWSQLGYAMLAGVAAGVQTNDTTITTTSPYGTYRTVISEPGLSGGQVAAVAAGGGAIALSQIGLQKTLERLDGEIMQTNTIDPQTGYGGRVVIRKISVKQGDDLIVDVDVGGEHHRFSFLMVRG